MKRTVVIASLLILGAAMNAQAVEPSKKLLAENTAGEITGMRSRLAATILPGTEITVETFKGVCGAVGKRAKEIAEKEGIRIRHAAIKYRNPANGANEQEKTIIGKFAQDKELKEDWGEAELEGKKFIRYSRPIHVEKSCLNCHGAKDKRPAFIAQKYPDDSAHGFNEGDLRGIITVLIPENP